MIKLKKITEETNSNKLKIGIPYYTFYDKKSQKYIDRWGESVSDIKKIHSVFSSISVAEDILAKTSKRFEIDRDSIEIVQIILEWRRI